MTVAKTDGGRMSTSRPTQSVAAAVNVDAEHVAELERLGFVVVCETNGETEEWVAMRDDLHLRAESPVQLLGLYSMRGHH